MDDDTIIAEAGQLHAACKPITDLQARVIAAGWHSGGAPALTSLSTSGAITEDLEHEIERNRRTVPDGSDNALALDGLLAYARRNGQRGPQPGWIDLSW